MAIMEGTLWKWTNYLSGWQPRWFVLEVGVLAYYKSQEEVGLGSRGSVKMACCEISVHASDSMRIDLKVPPDQHIYLRAATPAERQQWLVALGTAKACLTTVQHNGHVEMPGQSMGQLKEKMQELDMYRSLLLQQISSIKLLCSTKQDSQEFTEAATMLSATCDEFLKNICDCAELAESNFGEAFAFMSRSGSSPSSPTSPSMSMSKTLTTTKHSSLRRQLLHEGHRSSSPPPSPTSSVASTLSSSYNGPPSLVTTTSDQSVGSERTPLANGKHPSTQTAGNRSSTNSTDQNDRRHGQAAELDANSAATHQAGSIESSRQSLDSQSSNSGDSRESEPLTFFTAAKFRFEKIQMGADNGIPTKAFLSSCSSILPFLDVLGSTAFAPVKMDISGNIKKLAAKHDTDPNAFITLQNIVYQELKSNSCTAKNSATDALLWLKRALEFMQVFLSEVVRGEQDLAVAAGTAYGKTLRRFHGWVVRGVFALAVKAVPYRSDFLTSLGTTEKGVAPNEDVLRDMKPCVDGLGRVTSVINQLYQKHNLDSDSTV